ncbi:hypothetical protein FRC12_023742 [Ceratobasidium sp. 428]|nr:hypothetical protein FRC12_023742 [Ceratobasidium sp. 428]
MDVPLSKNGYTSVGYGPSGMTPFAYRLDEGQKFDVGIIKLFVTTSPANFGLLEQESPFEEGGRGSERKVVISSRLASVERWDTQYMVLIQRDELTEPEPIPEPVSVSQPDSKIPHALAPVAPAAIGHHAGVLNDKYGIWVVIPAALALSCVPFISAAFKYQET